MKTTISASLYDREVLSAQFNRSLQTTPMGQLVVIDSEIDQAQQLVQGVSEHVDAIILSSERDGIEQITEALQQRGAVHSLHLVAHGSTGQLTFGKSVLNAETLARYAKHLSQWSHYVSDSLLLYGCNLAAGEAGEEFLIALQQITKLAIAASTSKVGNPKLGGSWELDVTLGRVDARSPFLPIVHESYAGVFPDLGTALQFTGVNNSKVSVPDSPELRITGTFTLETLVKIPPVTGGIYRIAGKGTDYLLTIRNGGQVEFFRDSDNRIVLSSTSPTDPTVFTVDDDQWHHIATTFDGSSIRLYIDGVLRGLAQGVGGGFNTSSDAFQIGDVDPPNGPSIGLIDEVRVWNVARTEAEILAAKDTQLTGTETGLVAYYNFNEGTGNTLTDRTGNGNNGTLENLPNAAWVASLDTNIPTVDIVDVAPDPRGDAVNSITINFSEAVKNVDLTDLSLTVGGAAVDLSAATLTSTDGVTWVLGNLGGLTGAAGSYQLTLATSDITDLSGKALSAGATDAWVRAAAVVPEPPEPPTNDPFAVASPLPDPQLNQGKAGTTSRGRSGRDVLKGTTRNDRLSGLGGSDTLNGGGGNDFIKGGGGNDQINGGRGDDQLLGDGGNDTLIGGAGDDLLIGGPGRDRLRGGAGADTFRFNGAQDFDDVILDYSTDDVIDLRQILGRAEFAASSKTAQLQQFVQLTQVGSNAELRIDADGSGAGTNFALIATLNGVNLATTTVNIVV